MLTWPHFPPLQNRADFSTPAYSTPAKSCRCFHSRIFYPCKIVPMFALPPFPPLHFRPCRFFHSRIFSRPDLQIFDQFCPKAEPETDFNAKWPFEVIQGHLFRYHWRATKGGAEFAGPENDGPKKIKDWKMQDLENDRPNRSSGSGKRLLLFWW